MMMNYIYNIVKNKFKGDEDDDLSIKLNPYKILNGTENDFKNINLYPDPRTGDYLLKHYEKIVLLEKRRLFLSYFMICNPNKFDKVGDTFYIKNKDHFYYVIMNDLDNLKKLYEQNKYILTQKDNYYRTLLHLAVIGEYYEITRFLLEKGINYDEADLFRCTALYYANGDIKRLLSGCGATLEMYNDGRYTKGINIRFYDNNKIEKIYDDFIKSDIKIEKEIIKKNNDIIGKRFHRFKKMELEGEKKNWISVYHGTKFVSMKNILIYGLQSFGEPLNGHIPLGETIYNIENWADAIFVSPSIFYASKYSDIINTDNEDWFIIIEAIVRPGSFTSHKSTLKNYQFRKEEPEVIEYRIKTEKICVYDGGCGVDDIITSSLLFIKKKYLDNIINYNDFSI